MDKDPPPGPPESASSHSFWQELKRRHVVRVAIVYAVVAWLIIQIASTTFSGFGIPDWAFRFVVLMVLLGFPVSLIIAWAFELTPAGVKTTKAAQKEIRLLENTARHAEGIEDSKTYAKKRGWFSLTFAAAAPTLIFGILALYFYFQAKPAQESQSPLINTPITQSTEKSIAVLPLDNLSPDPDNEFFCDGVHEDILTNLSKVRDLLVIGRTSTLQYRDTVKTLKQIAEELDVCAIWWKVPSGVQPIKFVLPFS